MKEEEEAGEKKNSSIRLVDGCWSKVKKRIKNLPNFQNENAKCAESEYKC